MASSKTNLIIQSVFKNKILTGLVIVHKRIEDYMNPDNSYFDPVKMHRIVKRDYQDGFYTYCESLYNDWIYPLNFTFSCRYNRLKSNIKSFKGLRKKQVDDLYVIYQRPDIKEKIDKYYEGIDVEDEYPIRNLNKARRDFFNWVREYMEG